MNYLQPGPLTPEERALLLRAVELKLKDIHEGRPIAALHIEDFERDPLWVLYADLFLGGSERLVSRLRLLTKEAGARRIIPRRSRRGRDRV